MVCRVPCLATLSRLRLTRSLARFLPKPETFRVSTPLNLQYCAYGAFPTTASLPGYAGGRVLAVCLALLWYALSVGAHESGELCTIISGLNSGSVIGTRLCRDPLDPTRAY